MTHMMHETWVNEGDLLWAPSEHIKKASRMMAYMAWLEENNGLELNDYHALWEWSVSHVPEFWESVWQFLWDSGLPALHRDSSTSHAGGPMVHGLATQLRRTSLLQAL